MCKDSFKILILKMCLEIIYLEFANDPGDMGSIPGRVIPKTQKWYLIPLCLAFSIIR